MKVMVVMVMVMVLNSNVNVNVKLDHTSQVIPVGASKENNTAPLLISRMASKKEETVLPPYHSNKSLRLGID